VRLLKKRKLIAVTRVTATSAAEYRVAKPWIGRVPG